jgi:hypothetical protein
MASTLGSTSKHAEHFNETLEVASLETFQKILDSTEVDLKDFCDDMAYLGFDKTKIAKLAAKNLGGFLTVKFCLLGAMRGTNLEKIISKSVKPDPDVKKAVKEKKIQSTVTSPDSLTVGRLLSTFPEIAAYYMLNHKVPPKLIGNACPAALQFPSAAGLPMSHTVRLQHLEFAIQFSFLISQDKKFHPVYYMAAFNGQVETKRLNSKVQDIVGKPTNAESKAVDMDSAIQAMMVKYGAERFDLKNYAKVAPTS